MRRNPRRYRVRPTEPVVSICGGVAVIPISEILTAKGVDYAGSLAPDIQFLQVFSAAVVAGSGEVDNAKRLTAFFASPRAAEAIKKSGMEPVASAR